MDWLWSIAALYFAGWLCGYVATCWWLGENESSAAGLPEAVVALAAAAYTSIMWLPVLIKLALRSVRRRHARPQ